MRDADTSRVLIEEHMSILNPTDGQNPPPPRGAKPAAKNALKEHGFAEVVWSSSHIATHSHS